MIEVVIVEDVEGIREGLRLLIDGSDGFSCRSVYASAEEALAALPGLACDVVLMDIQLPGIDGIECVRRLRRCGFDAQIIMSTVYEHDEHIFESLKAGATGYLLKKTEPVKLLEAIREVHQGGSPMSAPIARKVIASFRQVPAANGLTRREEELLGELAKGLRYKEIAAALEISIDTVRSHVRHIYEKLQVQSRTEALNKWQGS